MCWAKAAIRAIGSLNDRDGKLVDDYNLYDYNSVDVYRPHYLVRTQFLQS